jgi:tRNA A-37 threonylcarbamoyl transferase component Bud32
MLTEFIGDVARKKGAGSLLAVEATKTKLARKMGQVSGLFYVPKVLSFDADKGVLDFERLGGLVTLHRLAVDRDVRSLELFEKAGRALAVVHEQLVLPDEMKYGLPSEWMSCSDEHVFIHGDFASVNVCLHKPSGQLVILDWSAAPLIGRTPTFGSRHFDILWFASCAFRGAPIGRVLRWNAEEMTGAFFQGYAKTASEKKLEGIRSHLPKICRLQRKMIWCLARRHRPLIATAYIFSQMFMFVRFYKFLRKYDK